MNRRHFLNASTLLIFFSAFPASASAPPEWIALALADLPPEAIEPGTWEDIAPSLREIQLRLGPSEGSLSSLEELTRRWSPAEGLYRSILERIYSPRLAWQCAPFASRCSANPRWEEPWTSTAR